MASNKLSDAQIARFKDAFAVFDRDGSGRINVRELTAVMRNVGTPITEPEAKEMIAEVDDDGSGELSFPEFLKLMAARLNPSAPARPSAPSTDDLSRVFSSYDKDGDGFVSFAELKRGLLESGYDMTAEAVREMMSIADTSGDGRINYREFVKMLKGRK